MPPRRVVIVGAGAAGIMAAIWAAEAGADTLLLERTEDGGKKILISGGGRCNVLPARLDESRFVTDSSPHSLKKIVRTWPLAGQIAFFEQDLGIALAEETETGKLFPLSNRARDVRDGLLSRAKRSGARVWMNALVTDVQPAGGEWRVVTAGGVFEADAVVLATGGLSVPQTGSDGRGLAVVSRLGHTVHATYPALTPLTKEGSATSELAGISLTVTLTARSERHTASATGGFLFTHRGFSGPSVLDVSHVVTRAQEAGAAASVFVQWASLEAREWDAKLQGGGQRLVRTVVREVLPERLALMLVRMAGIPPETGELAHLRREDRVRLVDLLTRFDLAPSGHEGYRKAEVTGGGVDLSEIDPRTMESRKRPGLFLCGEMLDAFGPIGGYNFLWAWATGKAAGLGAAASHA